MRVTKLKAKEIDDQGTSIHSWTSAANLGIDLTYRTIASNNNTPTAHHGSAPLPS